MAQQAPRDRLQPALLDRLIDLDPQRVKSASTRRIIDRTVLRKAVLRDLRWLFNTTNMGKRLNHKSFPEVARSVLNFGLPPLSGETASTLDIVELERTLRKVIEDFEPRIDPDSLQVDAVVSDSIMDQHNVVSIEIRGALWGQPAPQVLVLRTDVDLETGEVLVKDLG